MEVSGRLLIEVRELYGFPHHRCDQTHISVFFLSVRRGDQVLGSGRSIRSPRTVCIWERV